MVSIFDWRYTPKHESDKLRRRLRRQQRGRDHAQDERIEALEAEVEELRGDLAALVELLRSKGVVDDGDVRLTD